MTTIILIAFLVVVTVVPFVALFWRKPKSVPPVLVPVPGQVFREPDGDDFPTTLLVEALEEQVRREEGHPIDYRNDQRELAVQQRMSRSIGKRAFEKKMADRIQKEIDAHPVLGPWHRS
jgi:hypothetical protein